MHLVISDRVLCLTCSTRKRNILFLTLLVKPYGEVETTFELEVFVSEAFFMIKTNVIIFVHMVTIYANQFSKGCEHLSDDILETSCYECITDSQCRQVTWSGGQPDQDVMLNSTGKK